jgi:hypothetical protein
MGMPRCPVLELAGDGLLEGDRAAERAPLPKWLAFAKTVSGVT